MDKFVLDSYSDLLILNNGLAACTRFSEATNNLISHDKFTRFLNSEEYTGKDLWRLSKEYIKSASESKKCFLAIDDSIIEKPYTKENDIVCWHYCHAKGRCLKGIQLLTLLCVFEDAVIPFSYKVIEKTVSWCDLETKKVHRTSLKTKNELARSLIEKALEAGVDFDTVLADNWFCSGENLNFINNLDKKFIFGIKSNRNIYNSLEERENNAKTKLSQADLGTDDIVPVFLNSLDFQVRVMKKVFKNENGSQGILYLVTNDADLGAEDLYTTYQKRWKIEVYHKSIKENGSLAKSPTKVRKSQINHIFCSLYAFVKLESIKLKIKKNHFAMKREIHIYSLKAAAEKLREFRNMVA